MTPFHLTGWLRRSICAGLFTVIGAMGARHVSAQTESFPIEGGGGSSVTCLSAGAIQRTGKAFGSSPTTVTGCILAQDAPYGLAALAVSVYCKGGSPIRFDPGSGKLQSCTLANETNYLRTSAGAQAACQAGVTAQFSPDGWLISCGAPQPPLAQEPITPPSRLPIAPPPRVVPAGGSVRGMLTMGTPVAAVAARVGPAGATLRVDKPGDPLSGFALTVPAGAYPDARDVRVSHRPITGHGYGADVNPVSPLITVEAGAGYAASGITVRVPIALPAGHFAMGFFYDEKTGRLEGMPLVELGNDHVTVHTRHFSSFFITSISEGLLGRASFDTGFLPGRDDWAFTNHGSFPSPGGICDGQSVSMIWYFYERRVARREPTLFKRYDNDGARPATPDLWEDDVRGYRLASVVQRDIAPWRVTADYYKTTKINDSISFLSLSYAMRLTASPQLVGLYSTRAEAGAHAVVAYRIAAGKVFVADPNWPGAPNRSIPVTAGRFGPYDGAEKAGEDESSFDIVRYEAVTAEHDWELIGTRWAELEAGTIGAGLFPSYDIVVKDSTGATLPLRSSALTTASSRLTVEVVMPTYEPGVAVGGVVSLGDPRLTEAGNAAYGSARPIDLKPGDNAVSILVVGGTTDQPTASWVDFRRYRITVPPREAPKTGHWTLKSTEHTEEQPYESRVPDCPAVQQSATDQSVTFTVAFRGNCTYDKGTATIATSWTPPPTLTPGTPFPMTLSVNGNAGIVAKDGVNLHRVQGALTVETSLYQCRGSECRASGVRESPTVVWASFEPGALPSGTVLGSTTFQVEGSDTPITRPGNFQPADVFRVSVRSSEVGEGGGLATTMRHVVTHTYGWQPAR